MRARTAAWALAVFLALTAPLAGCGKDSTPPVAPIVRLGPAVEEVFPAARAIRVPVDVVAWARFREPLDPATLTTTNVFLKLDTERQPIALSYDAATRTLSVRALVELKLRRTYTVELSPRIETAGGVALDSTYFWQFTTTTIRRLQHPIPADGASGQSPFVALGWDATESSAGLVRYDVYAAADSATAAARAGTPVTSYYGYAWTPSPRPFDGELWWTVHATNLETGETADGPLWHFRTLAASTPVDSVTLQVVTFCAVSSRAPTTSGCNAASLGLGAGSWNTAIRWSLAALPADARVAGARMIVYPIPGATLNTAGTVIRPTTTAFDGCASNYTSPKVDTFYGVLATGVYDPVSLQLVLASDALAGHVQCARQFGIPSGYSFAATNAYTMYSPTGSETRQPMLRVYTYRQP